MAISEHNDINEAFENALEHAEDNGAGTYRVDPPWMEVDVPVMSVISRPVGRPAIVPAASNGYVATHYVAPFAQVPGAADDEDIQNQTAFDNASNPSTPCTIMAACRWAVAGNVIRAKLGTYTIEALQNLSGGGRLYATICPTNNGTLGNPIIFFAENPAAYNRSSPSLWSKLSRPTPTYLGGGINAIIGASAGDSQGRNYVIFDGFYVDEIESRPGPSGGIVQIQGGSIGIEIRRFYFGRAGGSSHGTWSGSGNGYDGNSVWTQNCTDGRVVDCYWEGADGSWPANDGEVQCYGATNFVVEHCTVNGPTGLSYFKAATNRNCVSRYNWIEFGATGTNGVDSQICSNTEFHHNFIKAPSQSMVWFNPAQAQISAATSANPIQFTTENPHLLVTGDVVSFGSEEALPGDFGTNLNGTTHVVTVVNSTQFTIAVNGSGYAAYTSGGTTQIVTPIQAHHNTLVCTGGNFNSAWYMRNRPANGGDQFHSNIVVINGSAGGAFCNLGDGVAPDVAGNFDRFNYNVYYRIDAGTPRWEVGASAYTTFGPGAGSYKNAMAAFGTDPYGDDFEEHSIYSDPLFVNSAAGNYNLQGGSPARTSALGGGIGGAFDDTGEVGIRANPTY